MNPLSMNMLLFAQEESNSKVAETVIEAAQDVQPSTGAGWLMFLIVMAVIILPFVIGNMLAAALKMRDYASKIGIVLFALTLGMAPFATQIIEGNNPLNAVDLGIDLAGGSNMTFAVDRERAAQEEKEINGELMDKMTAAISRRVNPTGTEEVTVRRVGEDRIEVIVPGADKEKRDQTKRQVTDLGELEFALLANEVDHEQIIRLADSLGNEAQEVFRDGSLIAMWRESALDEEGLSKVNQGDRVHVRTIEKNGKQVEEFLCVVDPDPKRRITGRLLKSVKEAVTDSGLAVGFTFNERGGYLFQQVTSKHQPKPGSGYKSRLAVLLNGEIHSAPVINGPIGATGVIEGGFTQEQIDELLGVLNAGALEVPLIKTPVSEFTVSPLLGADVQRKGFTAIGIALAAVVLFMLFYYLQAGFVADVCLLVNLILVLGVMSLIDATFTLPGLAGLVLTIGMAVDSNVLIFERMREEKNKGSSLRMSIKNGFDKALSTIIDANVTTLITAVVLYYIGTDQVKGFAVTLFIGILMSMFAALYVGRLIFDIAEYKKWLTDLNMMSLIKSENFNFMGKTKVAVVASIALIVLGMGAVVSRNTELLDIDFLGGSMVTFEFAGETPEIGEVQKDLKESFPQNSLERLSVIEESGVKTMYRLRTPQADADVVSQGVKAAFADTKYKLIQQNVTIGEVTDIPPKETAALDASLTTEAPDKFAGGHLAQVSVSEKITPASFAEHATEILSNLKEEYKSAKDLVTGSAASEDPKVNQITLKFAGNIPVEDVNKVLAETKADMEKDPFFAEVNTFDTTVAGDAKWAAISAMLISLVAIIAYLWVRFQRVTFGLAASVAIVHDVFFVLGTIAISGMLGLDYKINLPIVAAFLTIIGYSLNDTIVVFDRIREVRGRNPALTESMVNTSLNQTLSRTLLTSLTTLVVVLILWLMGGEGIEGFAFCLIVGVVVGTYSTIYIASPALIWLMNRESKTVKTVKAA